MSGLGVVVGGTQQMDPRTKESAFSFDVVDLDAVDPAHALRRIPLDFLGHGFSTDPTRPHVAVVFEKRGPGGALVDLAEGRRLGILRTLPGRAFYGHGAYARDGSVVFVVETDLTTRAGLLTVRDGRTFAILDEMPTFGASPHDCVLTRDGATLVVTNGGGVLGSSEAPCVTYVDVSSKKLLELVTFGDPKINAGHLALDEDSATFAVSSAPRDGLPEKEATGAVTFRSGKRKPEKMKKPEAVTQRMKGESLSVCIHPATGATAVTNPWGDVLTFWDASTRRLRRALDLELPRGVVLSEDGTAFVVTYGKTATIAVFDATTLERVHGERDFGTSRLSGSHVYAWSPS